MCKLEAICWIIEFKKTAINLFNARRKFDTKYASNELDHETESIYGSVFVQAPLYTFERDDGL